VILIGLTGRARSGKTTVASTIYNSATALIGGLSEVSPYQQFLNHSQVGIYDIGEAVLNNCRDKGLIRHEKTRMDLNKDDFAVMQEVGLKNRNIALSVIRTANAAISIFPNIRYKDEAAELQDRNGEIIRVVRLNTDGSGFISSDRDANHPSETSHLFVKPSYVLTAFTGQDEYLSEQARTLFRYIFRKHAN
jgi:hypothetical protein